MRTSTNYGLKLPEGTDNVRRKDFVENFEIIDREMKNNDTSMKEIANKVDNIKIADATIAQKGIVQLNNTTNSTSITQAATANAVKLAMDRANSAFQSASDGKNAIAGKVGNVTGNNTHAEIANRIQTDKNTAANNLNNKGVSASGTEALASLVSKIAQISVQGMGGKRFLTGTATISSDYKTFTYVGSSSTVSKPYITINSSFPISVIIAGIDSTNTYYKGCIMIRNNACFMLTVSSSYDSEISSFIEPLKSGNSVYLPVNMPSGNNLTYLAFE
ncbi:tail fiber protein [Clostridium botulinum]|uniref:tail fiber protein n=1 Tax=Clostridium botulinum TaxID=1491 RepID=UPI0007733D5F|nr:phage tail protein [Clostridium botulinum]